VSVPEDSGDRTALIHRELVQLALLVFVAVIGFFVTRAVAESNRDLSTRNAAEWYRRGEQLLAAGRTDAAIDAFRRATVRNRTNRTYLLALARGLAGDQDYDAARDILLSIRDTAPDDAAINLDLARLSAARQDVTEALRFYHDALYAPWPAKSAEQRRVVRIELIRFLLTHAQVGRAQSELLAARADTPDDAAHHIELAGLMQQASDDRSALQQFQQALRLDPDNRIALAGAGAAAFDIEDYTLARRYLHQLPDGGETVQRRRDIADLVLSRDPIAARIGVRERHRRLDDDVSYAQQRIGECVAKRGSEPAAGEQALQTELRAFQTQLLRSATLDQDTVESGIDLIARAEDAAITSCGPASIVDEALRLIARQHGVASQ